MPQVVSFDATFGKKKRPLKNMQMNIGRQTLSTRRMKKDTELQSTQLGRRGKRNKKQIALFTITLGGKPTLKAPPWSARCRILSARD